MDVLLGRLAALPGFTAPAVRSSTLRRELRRWGQTSTHPDAPAGLYLLGQVTWSRIHGVVSLELEGNYAQMGLAGGEIFAAEVQAVIDLATAGATNAVV